jgi:hypothetical protein
MTTQSAPEPPSPVTANPPPDGPAVDPASDAAWDEMTFGSLGPRYWNLGCG